MTYQNLWFVFEQSVQLISFINFVRNKYRHCRNGYCHQPTANKKCIWKDKVYTKTIIRMNFNFCMEQNIKRSAENENVNNDREKKPFPHFLCQPDVYFFTFADNLIRMLDEVSIKWSNFLLKWGGFFSELNCPFCIQLVFFFSTDFHIQKNLNNLIKIICEEYFNDRNLEHRTLNTISSQQ